MIKLVIFDLDGTLLNTISDLSKACNVALEQFNYPLHTESQYKQYVGSGIYKLVERALPETARDEANVLRVKAVFDAYYKEHSLDQTKPYEGIMELLKHLKEKGIQLGVVSNKAHPYTMYLVKLFFGEYITHIYGQREGIPVKPDPTGVLSLIEETGVSKEACLYVGDSDIDVYTAKNAEVRCAGVLWGFRGEAELKVAGADELVGTVKELEQLILNKVL